MADIKRYVDRLFANHKETRDIRELKAEILSNLEARIADYTEEGMPYAEAFALATQQLDTVDFLIEDNRPVYINRYQAELAQAGLLYTVIAWILTIPLRIMFAGVMVNNLLTLAVITGGVIYLAISSQKGDQHLNTVAAVNRKTLRKLRKTAWLIWGLFAAVISAFTTVKHFGSDFWFGRAVNIDGPYQFAVIVTAYALPLITVILPLLFGKASKLAEKYEVKS